MRIALPDSKPKLPNNIKCSDEIVSRQNDPGNSFLFVFLAHGETKSQGMSDMHKNEITKMES